MMLSGHGGERRLFTASQWQELEHQALIFKYMASGAPVPHDLVLPLRLATGVDTAPSLAFPPQPSPSLAYWGCYGAGAPFGRKAAEDTEPGRCRRTDGKKWRCSREAHGDSKYCEKHIHRGKSRSRKPVEVTSSPAAGAAAAYRPSAISTISPPRAADAPPPSLAYPQQHLLHGASSSAAARAPAGALQLHLDASLHAAAAAASPSPPPSYHRYAHYTPPASSLFPGGGYGYDYDYGQSKELRDAAELRRRHFHALGADLSLDKPLPEPDTGSDEKQPLRRFLDEWPRESGDMAADDATQLSISIPAASPSDLAAASAAAARFHNGE
uniref:Growth-regulating factor n=1 Tax=Zea mays TaxID=4577 RepID=B6THG8_MAIZE|nr:atGRF5 [Zea mays]